MGQGMDTKEREGNVSEKKENGQGAVPALLFSTCSPAVICHSDNISTVNNADLIGIFTL